MHAHIIFINKIKYMLNTYIRKIQNLHMYIYVSVNLNTTRVCSLPSYPGVDGQGPVVLTYLENQRLLVACGSSDRDDKSCYQLSPDNPSGWEPLSSLTNTFCILILPGTYNYLLLNGYCWDKRITVVVIMVVLILVQSC